jgi:hypothetical protein
LGSGARTRSTAQPLSPFPLTHILVVALHLAQHLVIHNARQHAHGIGAVQGQLMEHVLDQALRDNEDVAGVRGGSHLLDEQVHHAPQVAIRGLEELGHAKKDLQRL